MIINLKEYLNYNPITGEFRWLKSNSNRVHVGDLAGYLDTKGYITIRYFGKLYQAHRLAWLYMTGEFPNIIDHINRNRKDNRFENLRDVSASQNNMNSKTRIDNTSGIRGVSKFRNKWRARSSIKGKEKHLGIYETKEKAEQAYLNFINT